MSAESALSGASRADHFTACRDLDQCWLTPKDEEDYEEALSGMYNSLFGDPTSTTAEVVDEAFGVLARRYSPKTAPQAFELMNSIHGVRWLSSFLRPLR